MATNANPRAGNGPESTPKAVAKWIGRQYVESRHLPGEGSEKVERAYSRLSDKIRTMYQAIPVRVVFQEADPYSDYYDMKETVDKEEFLRIYDGHTDEHEYFSERTNLEFRAVHDYWGHLAYDVDFSPEGEFWKWFRMVSMDRDDFGFTFDCRERDVLFAEVVGQVGAVHYLKDGFEDPRYTQRAFFAPEEWRNKMREACVNV